MTQRKEYRATLMYAADGRFLGASNCFTRHIWADNVADARRIAEEQYPDNPVFNVVAVRPARKWGD